jgi:hypothetical protein
MEEFDGFQEIEVVRGDVQLVWEWIGEGYEGDFNDEDPDDEPLLRFSVYARNLDDTAREEMGYPDEEWVPVEDASYCTGVSAKEDREELTKALELMSDRVWGAFQSDSPPTFGLKGTCEDLSHITIHEVRQVVKEEKRRAYEAAPDAPEVGEIGERSRLSPLGE